MTGLRRFSNVAAVTACVLAGAALALGLTYHPGGGGQCPSIPQTAAVIHR